MFVVVERKKRFFEQTPQKMRYGSAKCHPKNNKGGVYLQTGLFLAKIQTQRADTRRCKINKKKNDGSAKNNGTSKRGREN